MWMDMHSYLPMAVLANPSPFPLPGWLLCYLLCAFNLNPLFFFQILQENMFVFIYKYNLFCLIWQSLVPSIFLQMATCKSLYLYTKVHTSHFYLSICGCDPEADCLIYELVFVIFKRRTFVFSWILFFSCLWVILGSANQRSQQF